MVISERDDGIRIIRVTRPEEAIAFRASFAGAYQTVFSDPPYNERYFPSEATAVLRNYLQTPEHITLLAVRGRSNVVGFGIAVPLSSRPDVSQELLGLLPIQHSWYLAELGVLSAYRKHGLGRQLVNARIEMMDPRFSHVVLRTSAQKNWSYDLYMSMGFDDMGVYMEVAARRHHGRVSTDRRLFLSKMADAEPQVRPSTPSNAWKDEAE